ncbi:nose resistant to fluoxetine protein 6 isoform X2 [Malaya genurostris]|uniref:nose resistant to fluoxetine protein 6 isoform X2 n=1 Tax=Malaya genurostris TaxID=325434 RepID=UPI0026F3E5C2|nr:nose resistant to fluoxetine protein 6 isoform X2 [Malaya genurostris]
MVKWVHALMTMIIFDVGCNHANKQSNESGNRPVAVMRKNMFRLMDKHDESKNISVISDTRSDLKNANIEQTFFKRKVNDSFSHYEFEILLNDNVINDHNEINDIQVLNHTAIKPSNDFMDIHYKERINNTHILRHYSFDNKSMSRLLEPSLKQTAHLFKENDNGNKTNGINYLNNTSHSYKSSTIVRGETTPINIFHLFTELYDHHLWNISTIKQKLSYDCAVDMSMYLQQLRNQRYWALKVSDSSGRYSGQALFGNDFWLGSKTFCEESNKENPLNNETIEMSFYVASVKIKIYELMPKPKILQLGQCLPKKCIDSDVYIILSEDPKARQISNDQTCWSNSSQLQPNCNELNIFDIRLVPGSYNLFEDRKFFFICLVLLILIATILFATYYESIHKGLENSPTIINQVTNLNQPAKQNSNSYMKELSESNSDASKFNLIWRSLNFTSEYRTSRKTNKIDILCKILLCFAAGSNSRAILSVDSATKDSIACVHGLRLYSLLWTIMVHTYLQLFAVGENRYGRKITERSFSYQVVGNATFSVDTFFFISGLLVTVLFFRSTKNETIIEKADRKHTFINTNLFQTVHRVYLSVLYRFLRLTPAYFFVITFNELALKWTYGKSVFTPGITDDVTCHKFWWRNILYINNWYPFDEMCMIWSWYLANDMQFYVVALTLLALSTRYFKLSMIMAGLLMICSWITSIVISIKYNYSYKVSDPFESFDILYDKPWQRITPYLIGMFTGYIYYFRNAPPKISNWLNGVLWMGSSSIILVLVFGVWNGQLPVRDTALYVSLGHTAWGIALVWITLSCCWGYASPVNKILSYRAFYPLSRLSYCAYLLHPVIMMVTSFQMEAPMHLQHVIVTEARTRPVSLIRNILQRKQHNIQLHR